jgi:hypothetical protein
MHRGYLPDNFKNVGLLCGSWKVAIKKEQSQQATEKEAFNGAAESTFMMNSSNSTFKANNVHCFVRKVR